MMLVTDTERYTPNLLNSELDCHLKYLTLYHCIIKIPNIPALWSISLRYIYFFFAEGGSTSKRSAVTKLLEMVAMLDFVKCFRS